MSKVTAADVNKLRKQTGAGMMDCKKALVEAESDFEKAIEILRKKGQKIAAKRADRESTEGAVIAKTTQNNKVGVLVSLNCETDFVAKNEDFIKLASDFVNVALEAGVESKEDFLKLNFEGMTVEEKLIEQTGVIGEKIEIQAYEKLSAPFVGAYIHAGNKIASMVALSHDIQGVDVVAKDVAMQVAAMNPIALNEEGVPLEVVEKEIEIAKDQLRQEGKPEAMLDQIAKGKLNRFFKDNTLINQAFIKDSKQTVDGYVKSINKNLKITNFVRVGLGV